MVLGTVRWLFQRLMTLVWPRLPRSTLGAFALPPEIILMITAYLPSPSRLCLAITCRTLYDLCFPQHSCLNTAEKEELLLLLEKDTASLYFCHYCTELHRWCTRWSNSIFTWVLDEDLPCQTSDRNALRAFGIRNKIPYHHVRLVMNRHFYGPSHGLPLKKLEDRCSSTYHPGIVESSSRHACIIDSKLLLHSVITLHQSRGSSKILRSFVDTWIFHACEHLTLGKGKPSYSPIQLPELVKGKDTPGRYVACDQSCGSCTLCPTDYCIDITWSGRGKGYVIKLSTYHQLGGCRSPSDWSWRTMSEMLTAEEPRTAFPLEYGPGSIRDRWNKAEGIDSRTECEWIEIPGLQTYRQRRMQGDSV